MGNLNVANSSFKNFTLMANGVMFTEEAKQAYDAYQESSKSYGYTVYMVTTVAIAIFACYVMYSYSFVLGFLSFLIVTPLQKSCEKIDDQRKAWVNTIINSFRSPIYAKVIAFMQQAEKDRKDVILEHWATSLDEVIETDNLDITDEFRFNQFMIESERKMTIGEGDDTLSIKELTEKAKKVEKQVQELIEKFDGIPAKELLQASKALKEIHFKFKRFEFEEADKQLEGLKNSELQKIVGMRFFKAGQYKELVHLGIQIE